jgi:hypothetical protein
MCNIIDTTQFKLRFFNLPFVHIKMEGIYKLKQKHCIQENKIWQEHGLLLDLC